MTSASGPALPVHASRPLLPEVGVVALVPDRWGPVWQTRHQVMTRLARFFRVVWVQPTVHWRERSGSPEDGPPPPLPAGFEVQRSLMFGFRRPRLMADLAFDLRIRRARARLRRSGCRRFVLYLWRPKFARALVSAPFDLSCYHIDDEYTFSRVEVGTSSAETELIRAVDRVFIHSETLFEKKGQLNPRTSIAPNGVDYEAFAAATREPADLSGIRRPRIGYTGMVKRQLDWELIRALTGRHADWSFVFVGKHSDHAEVRQAIAGLAERPNVHFLGAKPVWEIAEYPQHFDVCVMPYRRDDYTKYISPLKVHEYLAAGQPVVGARLPALEPFGHVVALASSADAWSAALEAALQPQAVEPQRVAARRQVARGYDWNRIVENIARTLAEGLGAEVEEGLRVTLGRAG